jgi:hypothetical protein
VLIRRSEESAKRRRLTGGRGFFTREHGWTGKPGWARSLRDKPRGAVAAAAFHGKAD